MSSTRSKVAVLRVRPQTILEDVARLCDLAGVDAALDRGAQTILKDNISWHFPFPGANTTPWQLEGTARALRARGYDDLICVQNKTVVTDAFKGEDLNGYVPVFEAYPIPVRYNFKPEEMTWSVYQPRGKMLVLDQIYPEGILIPDDFHGRNIVHLPTVKCLGGDTELITEDGAVVTIRELVERQLRRSALPQLGPDGCHAAGRDSVFAVDSTGAARPSAALHFSRTSRDGRRVLRLRTRTGRTLVATADHLIRTPSGWRAAGELAPGDRVALARRIAVRGEAQPLPQTHASAVALRVEARPGRVYSTAFVQETLDAYQAGATVTKIAASAGVGWQSIQAILKRHAVPLRRNVVPLSIPKLTTPGFWRWIGYVLAEGNVERGSSDKLWWVNSEPAIRDEFVALTGELFGIRPHCRSNGRVHVYSQRLGKFLEELGLPIPLTAANKRVPPLLFRCTDGEIAAFLSGYLDGDGSVSAAQAELSATTKSERLARDLQTLFSRLGVVAFVRPVSSRAPGWTESKQYFQVSAAGTAVLSLRDQLSLRHPVKRERLEMHVERLHSSKQPSNWDVVPLPMDTFRAVRVGLGLTQEATGRPSSVNSIENGHASPTPRIARYFVDLFSSRDTEGRFAREIAMMRALSSEDTAWDQLEDLEEVDDPQIDLYDVTVPETGCFVANGLVVHNCHIYTTTTGAMKNAFGGLLNTKRHYTHSWIHATLVDLLRIQQEIHSGLFAVMDGTTAGDGPGPRTMRPVIKDVMLASSDQVAIDAVAASMMGFDPMSIEYIRLAHEEGLGKGKPDEIDVVGQPEVAAERWGFSVGNNGASTVGNFIWFGPLKSVQKLFFHTPLVNLFVFGSEVYHDYYRWPLRDRAVFDAWRGETEWGRLFDQYQRQGTLAGGDTAARTG